MSTRATTPHPASHSKTKRGRAASVDRRHVRWIHAACAHWLIPAIFSILPQTAWSSHAVIACGFDTTTFQVEPANALQIVVDVGDSDALISIEEQGRDLEWRFSHDIGFSPIRVRPPRLGLALIAAVRDSVIEIRATGTNPTPAAVRIGLECAPSSKRVALAKCIAVAAAMDRPFVAMRFLLWQDEPQCSAFLFHSAASFAASNDDSQSARTLYASAANQWRFLKDYARAAAAYLGHAERLYDLGELDHAILAIDDAIRYGSESNARYFMARARMQKCLLWDYTNSQRPVDACYAGLTEEFERLGEISEAANVQYNLAFHRNHRGEIEAASRHLDAAAAFDQDLISPLVLGRLLSLASQLDLKRGLVSRALFNLQAAYESFALAGDRRWLANMNLQAARIYERLSSPEEAYVFLNQSRRFYQETEAKLRLISALELEARLQYQRGDIGAARQAAVEAARRYQREGVLHWAIDAWLRATELGAGEDIWREIDMLVAATPTVSDAQRIDIELGRAARRLRQGEPPDDTLIVRLERLSERAQSIEQRQHARRLQAQALIRSGDGDRAVAILEHELARQVRMVEALGTPALRHLGLRQARRLGAFWVDAVLASAGDGRPDAARLRPQLRSLRMESVFAPPPDADPGRASGIDAALAGAVLSENEDDPAQLLDAQRSLLRFYAAAAALDRAPAQLAVRIDAPPASGDAVQLTYALGEQRALLLTTRGEDVAIHEIGAPADIRRAAMRLAALAYRRDSRVDELANAAAELSALLLPPALAGQPPPSLLLVQGEELFAAIPFSLLSWPGQDWPLVESTAVSFQLGPGRRLLGPARAVDVLVAARPAGSDESSQLPWLRNAEVEPELIAAALPQAGIEIHAGGDAGRGRLDALLRRKGTWLHVAAHGTSRSGFQGLAGLWVSSPAGDGRPEFVSWLGLTERPLTASLVVLNACQLADTGAAVASSASFAAALAAAGVDNVVAARWQLSDNASTVWVPAFYRALREEAQGEVALAVRQAQLALRRSRQFRHPFYWSGLAHLAGGREARD